jgi:hypothetical protein
LIQKRNGTFAGIGIATERSPMKRTIAIIIAGAALIAGAVMVQHAGAQAGSPQARFAVGIVATDSSGFANVKFVRHTNAAAATCRSLSVRLDAPPPDCLFPMSDRPDTVLVQGVAPITGAYQPFQIMNDTWSTTGFRIRVRNPNGSLLTNQLIRITYRATSDPGGYCDANVCS